MLFYADFSSSAKRALVELEQFSEKSKEIPIYALDVESAQFYSRILFGAYPSKRKKSEKAISHRVVVYSGPGCPACGTAKSYLRRKGVNFKEIDIASNHSAAERLVRRSGQMAVPQIDINGHLIVGFDQVKIDKALST